MEQIQLDNFRIGQKPNFAFINQRNSIFTTNKSKSGSSTVTLKKFKFASGKIPLSKPIVNNCLKNHFFDWITSVQKK